MTSIPALVSRPRSSTFSFHGATMNIKIAINYDSREISNVGKLVRHLCVLSSEDAEPSLNQVELAVVELLNNIINYSKDVPVDGLIELNCRFVDPDFTVTVSDRGQEIDNVVANEYSKDDIRMPSVDISIVDLPESGWGIQLIKSACDEISYRRSKGKNIYRLSFDLSPATV